MTEKENKFSFLESMIKVEPEELQSSTFEIDLRSNVNIKSESKEFQTTAKDVILSSRVGIFADPVVLLERLSSETTNSDKIQSGNKVFFGESVKVLALKGNERLRNNDPHTCCVCQKVFSRRWSLENHLKKFHFKEKKMFCDLCPKFYFTRSGILSHVIVHSEKILSCNVCDYKTSIKSCFKGHKRVHTQNNASKGMKATVLALKGNEGLNARDPHTCYVCQKVCHDRYRLRNHLQKSHFIEKKLFCDNCPKFFLTKRDILDHMKRHRKKCFVCNICYYKTSIKTHFTAHRLTHAAKVECPICKKPVSSLAKHNHKVHKPKISCPVCQKPIQSFRMKQHMTIHTKAFKCGKCDQTFENKEALRRHNLNEHYNGKLFDCHCGSVFKVKYQLKKHQKVHKEKEECKVCRKQLAFISIKQHWRKFHLETHGRLETRKETEKILNWTGPFICDKCGSKSLSRASFRAHHKNYHGGFSACCDLCGRSFTRKHRLADHMKQVHIRLRPFECNDCSRTFFSIHCLNKHMLQHGVKTECKICHKFVPNMDTHLKMHVTVKCSI